MNRKEEHLLREFVRDNLVAPILEEQKREQQVRRWVRSLIREAQEETVLMNLYEAKDMANPHPNTGINKLRDALRKAKPSVKTKFQQLTTAPEQRESFTNHFLNAIVNLFDELDALSAQGKEAEEIDTSAIVDTDEIAAPPSDISSDDMAADIESGLDDLENLQEAILESILREIEVDVQDDEEVDIVSDEIEGEIENEKISNQTQVQKDFQKKNDDEQKRKDFGAGIQGDMTGRNQAFDAFNLVQSYLSDAYLDLNDPEDQEMFKKWGLYNIKLLLDKYEQELASNPEAPQIADPT
tara:strand:+ start:3662 stop:4552 length:891 start_codon:yes stop_codon:yes gene_type:complete